MIPKVYVTNNPPRRHRLYLIDGVRVTKKIYERRQIWGEHPSALFAIVDVVHLDRGR